MSIEKTITIRLAPDQDPAAVMSKIAADPAVAGIRDVSDQLQVVDMLARLETWDERCARDAVEDFGYRDPTEIDEHMKAAPADLDYLTGQDEALENLIARARQTRGTSASRDGIIAAALANAGDAPDLEDEDADGPGM